MVAATLGLIGALFPLDVPRAPDTSRARPLDRTGVDAGRRRAILAADHTDRAAAMTIAVLLRGAPRQ
jgi:hypothetical protein